MPKYRAASIQEAIERAKADLGPDALILEVRRIVGGDSSGGRHGDVEITAVSEHAQEAATPSSRYGSPGDPWEEPNIELLSRRVGTQQAYGAAQQTAVGQPAAGNDAATIASYLGQLGMIAPLSEHVARAATAPLLPDARRAAVAGTLEAAGLIGAPLAPRTGRQVIALVGPSGVGKTTTIAKLAAIIAKLQERSVAIVTTDTYRVGAVAQLSTFADILQLPFYSSYDRVDLQSALAETAEFDVVFIDTPGANPHNRELLKELRDLLGSRDPIDVFLTLAMTGDFNDLLIGGENFAILNPTGLIVTKIDETVRSPMLPALVQRLKLPLAYVCAGPEVPDHITLATPELLADLLLTALDQAGLI